MELTWTFSYETNVKIIWNQRNLHVVLVGWVEAIYERRIWCHVVLAWLKCHISVSSCDTVAARLHDGYCRPCEDNRNVISQLIWLNSNRKAIPLLLQLAWNVSELHPCRDARCWKRIKTCLWFGMKWTGNSHNTWPIDWPCWMCARSWWQPELDWGWSSRWSHWQLLNGRAVNRD